MLPLSQPVEIGRRYCVRWHNGWNASETRQYGNEMKPMNRPNTLWIMPSASVTKRELLPTSWPALLLIALDGMTTNVLTPP